ncbi:hypothetical protein [Abyssisolibacter fermentans]|uniref:hypothetical protein n=1 Tax=Abyssisolibacter fermentans TaxID=1766203 RepID=UPI000836839D|nr:hypothetical protein [Abyssisolibacter fermentans]
MFKKTLYFFLAITITLLFFTLVGGLILSTSEVVSENIFVNIIIPSTYSLALLIFAVSLCIIRNMDTKKIITQNTTFFVIKSVKFNLYKKIWFYLVITLIYFIPFLRGISLKNLNLTRIIAFIITIILFELLLNFSSKSVKIHFLRNGIVINGFDLRFEPPINAIQICNDTGSYSYNNIENYFIFPDHIEVYLILNQGKLSFKADSETIRMFTGIMQQKKIPMKKF